MYKRHIRNIKPVKDTQSLNRDNNDTPKINILNYHMQIHIKIAIHNK